MEIIDKSHLNRKKRVFLSYSFMAEESEFIRTIRGLLTTICGFKKIETVGITIRENEPLYVSISNAIEISDYLVCCFSKDYKINDNDDEWITKPSVYMEYIIGQRACDTRKAIEQMKKEAISDITQKVPKVKDVISFTDGNLIPSSNLFSSTQWISIDKPLCKLADDDNFMTKIERIFFEDNQEEIETYLQNK